MKTLPELLILLLALSGQASAQAPAQASVTELKPLLHEALRNGTARGTLTGPAATYIQQKFHSTAPIDIDVRTLHPLPQSGCARLAVTTHQRGVIEKDQPQERSLTYQLNYCLPGGFPKQS